MEKLFKDLKEFCKSKGLEEREAAYLLGLFTKHESALRQPTVVGRSEQLPPCSKCGRAWSGSLVINCDLKDCTGYRR